MRRPRRRSGSRPTTGRCRRCRATRASSTRCSCTCWPTRCRRASAAGRWRPAPGDGNEGMRPRFAATAGSAPGSAPCGRGETDGMLFGGGIIMATPKHSVLLVDDEPEILFSLRGLLRREFELYTAESGAQALELLHRQPVHVIMTDQRMPQMTGVELLRRAQGDCPEAIRLIFTGYADIKAVIDAINQGQIYRYLTKPWDPDELVAVLHDACEHYERIAERKRILRDLRDHVTRCQGLLQGSAGEQAAQAVQ